MTQFSSYTVKHRDDFSNAAAVRECPGATSLTAGGPCRSCGFPTVKIEVDALIEAVIDLEVAVDEFAANEFRFATFPYVTGQQRGRIEQGRAALLQAIGDASVAVVVAMVDGDISLVDSSYAANVIPAEMRRWVAAAEVGTLRALRAARALAV